MGPPNGVFSCGYVHAKALLSCSRSRVKCCDTALEAFSVGTTGHLNVGNLGALDRRGI
jgi:hypothetical protein